MRLVVLFQIMTGRILLLDLRASFKKSLKNVPELSNAVRRKERKRCHAKLYSHQLSKYRLVRTPYGVKFLLINRRRVALKVTLMVKNKN